MLCCAELMLFFREALQFPWLTSATGGPISLYVLPATSPVLLSHHAVRIILIKAQTCSCLGWWFPVALTLRYLENCGEHSAGIHTRASGLINLRSTVTEMVYQGQTLRTPLLGVSGKSLWGELTEETDPECSRSHPIAQRPRQNKNRSKGNWGFGSVGRVPDLPGMKPGVQSPTPNKLGMVAHTCNPRIEAVEARGSRIQGHPQIHSKMNTSPRYRRPWFKVMGQDKERKQLSVAFSLCFLAAKA